MVFPMPLSPGFLVRSTRSSWFRIPKGIRLNSKAAVGAALIVRGVLKLEAGSFVIGVLGFPTSWPRPTVPIAFGGQVAPMG